MTGSFAIVPLSEAHDRKSFHCGVPALDRYFQQQVTQDIRRRLSNCFVAVDQDGAVAGFYTFAATGLPMADLPLETTKRLPHYQLLPAGLIGRLAVAERFSKQGIGSAFLVDALSRAARSYPAVLTLLVDAKDDAAAAFYRHHGFQPLLSRQRTFFLPLGEAARYLGV